MTFPQNRIGPFAYQVSSSALLHLIRDTACLDTDDLRRAQASAGFKRLLRDNDEYRALAMIYLAHFSRGDNRSFPMQFGGEHFEERLLIELECFLLHQLKIDTTTKEAMRIIWQRYYRQPKSLL